MPHWRDEYLASIKAADETDPTNSLLLAACSALQDQVAALKAENTLLRSAPGSPQRDADAARAEASLTTAATAAATVTATATATAPAGATATAAQLRVDLAEALRSQGKFQSRLKVVEEELEALRAKTRGDARTIRALTAERNALTTKVRDRDEELRGKSKLVEEVQDELIALNLQLNIAEQQRDKVKQENKALVDRWMQRMGQEAEAMNLANEPFIARRS